MAEWNEDLHPRDHGKFSSSEGEHGTVTDAHRAKATESLNDREFLREHRNRLIRASDEAKAKFAVDDFGPNGRHGDIAHAAGQAAIHEELARIHAEHEAHGGDQDLKESAESGRSRASMGGASMAEQHAAAMEAISSHKADIAKEHALRENESRAIAAGHITTDARDIVDAYAAQHAEHGKAADEHIDALHDAHSRALDALGALNSHAHDEITDDDGNVAAKALELEHAHPDSLAEEFSQTHSDLAELSQVHSEHTYDDHEQHDSVEPPEHPEGSAADHAHPDKFNDWKEAAPHPDDPDLGDEFKPTTAEEHALMLAEHHEERAAVLADHEDYKAHVADFHTKLAEHHAEFRRRAETAQSALEDLHSKQVAAHTALKEITAKSERDHATATGKLDKMDEDHHVENAKFWDKHRQVDEGTEEDSAHPMHDEAHPLNNDDRVDPHDWTFHDPAIESAYRDAHETSRTFGEHHTRRLEELGSHDFSEGLGSLHSEMKSTSAAIRELSKHTGRAPKLAGKTKKGLKRRRRRFYTSPDGGAAAVAASY